MTPEELETRKHYLGSSQSAAAVGADQYKSPYELWLEFTTGQVTADRAPMEWGRRLEAVVLEKYAETCDEDIEYPCLPQVSTEYPWMRATLDARRPSRITEIKTTKDPREWGEPGTDEVPIRHLLQVHHQMVVTGYRKADIAVLIGGSDYRVYTVDYDAELAAMLIERERQFWQHVTDGTPPDIKTLRDANARWQKDVGTSVEATPPVLEAVFKLREVNEDIDRLEADRDALQVAIKTCMADASILTATGEVLATWKNQSRSTFNYQEFKATHPDLYKQFSTQQQTRVFRLAKGKL